jgi:hypothetical protein
MNPNEEVPSMTMDRFPARPGSHSGVPLRHAGQQGAVLIVGLIMLAVMTLLVISMLRTSILELRIGGANQVAQETFANAELAISNFLNVNIGFGCDFTSQNHKTCSYEGFTCHPAIRILAEHSIKNSIGNLIGHFIRMAFGNRFRRE